MNTRSVRKLRLDKETLTTLTRRDLRGVAAGTQLATTFSYQDPLCSLECGPSVFLRCIVGR
jgi:hypothetical protein